MSKSRRVYRSKVWQDIERKNPDPRVVKIYDWSVHLTAESKDFTDYYPTTAEKLIMMKLQYGTRNLIGLTGLQGTGKTTLLLNLAWGLAYKQLAKGKEGFTTRYIKWGRDWFESIMEEASGEAYRQELISTLQKKITRSNGGKRDKDITVYPEDTIEKIEGSAGTGRVRKAKKAFVISELQNTDLILIDFPDYTKTDRRMMNIDLEELQELWMKVTVGELGHASLLIAIQKELCSGHFFFGKMDMVNIDLLKPNDLVAAYKQQWKDSYPFTDDALLLVAQLSRGVFRRFLRYIKLCLERAEMKAPVTAEHVKAAITLEQVARDMDLELTDVFHTNEQKTEAVRLLNLLREKGETNQQQIAEALNMTETSASKLIRKLEAWNYVKRTRGNGKEWLVSLPLP